MLHRAEGLLQPFLDAAADLVAHGVAAITTNCGFLSLFQRELAAHVGVPVATSALMQVPWVQATLPPGRRVGVVTISAGSLTAAHLEAAGAPADTPMVGCDDGRELFPVLIARRRDDLDTEAAERTCWTRPARWWPRIRRSARSCWNAPTCRPTPAAVATRPGCRCSTR